MNRDDEMYSYLTTVTAIFLVLAFVRVFVFLVTGW